MSRITIKIQGMIRPGSLPAAITDWHHGGYPRHQATAPGLRLNTFVPPGVCVSLFIVSSIV